MDLKWLEDYIALVEFGNFTRAAESRFVTQPAFSRRIKSLENWLGIDLVDRNAYPMTLTELGSEYVEPIKDLLRQIYGLRTEMRSRANADEQLVVSTQHSLGVTYCPKWYSIIEPFLSCNSIRIDADNLHNCLEAFLARNSDLLLCYHAPSIYPEFDRIDIRQLELGRDCLLPVCSVDNTGNPLFNIPGQNLMPMIGFPPESFFGRLIFRECLPLGPESLEFDVVYETAQSEAVKSMVLQGVGMAWLPAGLIAMELEKGTIKQIDGLPTCQLTIMLYVHKSNSRKSITKFWSFLAHSIEESGSMTLNKTIDS